MQRLIVNQLNVYNLYDQYWFRRERSVHKSRTPSVDAFLFRRRKFRQFFLSLTRPKRRGREEGGYEGERGKLKEMSI